MQSVIDLQEAPEDEADYLTLTPLTQHVTLRVSSPIDFSLDQQTGAQSGNLLAISNIFGWIVIGGNEGFSIHSLPTIRTTLSTSAPHTIPEAIAHLQVTTPNRVDFLRFAMGDKLVLAGMRDGVVAVYRLKSLVEGNSSPLYTFAATPSPLLDVLPNPSPSSPLVILLSPTSLTIHNLETQSLVTSFPPTLLASSVCWSVKGKQIAVGSRLGFITQFTPEGVAKAEIGLPLELLNNGWEVKSLYWLENNVFLATYGKGQEHEYEVYTITRSSGGNGEIEYQRFMDPAPPYGMMERRGKRWITRFKAWNPFKHLIFMANAPCGEIGALGQSTHWASLALPEASRPAIPLNPEGLDTCPLGLEVDLCSPATISLNGETIPASPNVFVLTNEGILIAWKVVNEKGGNYGGIRSSRNVLTEEEVVEVEQIWGLATATVPSSVVAPVSAFGAPSTSAFGAPASSAFGSASPFGAPSASPFGAPAFGSSSPFGAPAFGNSGSGFNSSASSSTPSFGSSAFGSSALATSTSGATSGTGGFAGFGAAAGSSTTGGSTGGFGGFSSGSGEKPNIFGTSTSSTSPFSSGTVSAFGTSSTPSAFGAPSAFGTPSTPSAFGAPSASAFSTSPFGPSTTVSAFGTSSLPAASTPTPTASPFGSTGGFAGFGATAAAGSSLAASTSGFAGFGQAKTTSAFGTSAITSPTTSAFGSAAPKSAFSSSGFASPAPLPLSPFAINTGSFASTLATISTPSKSAFNTISTRGNDNDSDGEDELAGKEGEEDDRRVDEPPDLEPTVTGLDIGASMRDLVTVAKSSASSSSSSPFGTGEAKFGGLNFGTPTTTTTPSTTTSAFAPSISIFGAAAAKSTPSTPSTASPFGAVPSSTFGFGTAAKSSPFGLVNKTVEAVIPPAISPRTPSIPTTFGFGSAVPAPATLGFNFGSTPAAAVIPNPTVPEVTQPTKPNALPSFTSPPVSINSQPSPPATPPSILTPPPKFSDEASSTPSTPSAQSVAVSPVLPVAKVEEKATVESKKLFGFSSSPPPSLLDRISKGEAVEESDVSESFEEEGDEENQGQDERYEEEEEEEEEEEVYEAEEAEEEQDHHNYSRDDEAEQEEEEGEDGSVTEGEGEERDVGDTSRGSLLDRLSPSPATSPVAAPSIPSPDSSTPASFSFSAAPPSASSTSPFASTNIFGASKSTPAPVIPTPVPSLSFIPPVKAESEVPSKPAFFGFNSSAPKLSSPLSKAAIPSEPEVKKVTPSPFSFASSTPSFSTPASVVAPLVSKPAFSFASTSSPIPSFSAPAPMIFSKPIAAPAATPFSFVSASKPAEAIPKKSEPKPFSFAGPIKSTPLPSPPLVTFSPIPSPPISIPTPLPIKTSTPPPTFSGPPLSTTSAPKLGSQINSKTPSVAETGMAGEFVKAYLILQQEFELLRKNTIICKTFVRDIGHPFQAIGESNGYDDRNWSLGDLEHLRRETAEAEPAVVSLVAVTQAQKRQAATLQSTMLTAETKREEAARFIRARSDPVFAKMVRVRQLGPEQVENQKKIRVAVEAVRSRIEQLEQHMILLKDKILEDRIGRSAFKAPSLDSVHRAVRNITAALSEKTFELDDLTLRLDLVRIQPSLPVTTVTSTPRKNSEAFPITPQKKMLTQSISTPTSAPAPQIAANARAALNAERSTAILQRALVATRSKPVVNCSASASSKSTRSAPLADLQLAFAAGPVTGDRLPSPRRTPLKPTSINLPKFTPAPSPLSQTKSHFTAPPTFNKVQPSTPKPLSTSTLSQTPIAAFSNPASLTFGSTTPSTTPLAAPSWKLPTPAATTSGFPMFSGPLTFTTPIPPPELSSTSTGGSRGGAARNTRQHSGAVQLRSPSSINGGNLITSTPVVASASFDWGVIPTRSPNRAVEGFVPFGSIPSSSSNQDQVQNQEEEEEDEGEQEEGEEEEEEEEYDEEEEEEHGREIDEASEEDWGSGDEEDYLEEEEEEEEEGLETIEEER